MKMDPILVQILIAIAGYAVTIGSVFIALKVNQAVQAEKTATHEKRLDALQQWKHHVTDTVFPTMQRDILEMKRDKADKR